MMHIPDKLTVPLKLKIQTIYSTQAVIGAGERGHLKRGFVSIAPPTSLPVNPSN